MKRLVTGGEDEATKGTKINNVTKHFTLPSDKCLILQGIIKQVPIDFLLDTGVPMTLLRGDIWDRVDNKPQNSVQPWEGHRLVVINDSPIQVHRQRMIDTMLEENDLFMMVIVVNPLTTEIILGLED